MPSTVIIEEIDQEIASGTRFLRFGPRLEAIFEEETREPRRRLTIRSGLFGLVLYDLYLINDFIMMQDVFGLLAAIRLGVYTPLALIVLYLIYRAEKTSTHEILSIVVALSAVILPGIAVFFSASEYKLHVQLGTLLTMMYFTVVQRMRFRYAVFALISTAGMQLTITHLSGAFDDRILMANASLYVMTALLLFFAAYVLEHNERRNFLMILRGRLLQADLRRLTHTDPLTGLSNRRHLDEMTKVFWSMGASIPVSAILIDIDHFKSFNDNYGHPEGDACLRQIAAAVSRATLASGLADTFTVRFGGEEILVLLPWVDFETARRVAEGLHGAVRDEGIPHPAIGEKAIVTASFGVATVMAPATSPDDLVAAADAALYVAKHSGRDRVCPARSERTDTQPAIRRLASA